MTFGSSFTSSFSAISNAKNQRETLAFEKKKRDQELEIRGYDSETLKVIPGSTADVQQVKNDQTLQLAKGLEGKLAAQDTDQAILDFSDTGDATYLQGALDKNPTIKQAWAARGVQHVANLDWQNDTKLLKKNGFQEAEYDTEAKQALLSKNVYKFYNGKEWQMGLLNKAAAETGATTRIGENRGQQITNNYQAFRDFMSGPRSSANTAEGHRNEREIIAATEETGVPANLLAAMSNTDTPQSADSIKENSKHMASMLERYNGDTQLALAAFNVGPEAVDKQNGVPPAAQSFVTKILKNYTEGEKYYTDNRSLQEGQQMGARPSVRSLDLQELSGRQARTADNRIATIQNFVRGNVNAAKGTTSFNVDVEQARKIEATDIAGKAVRAKQQANLVKLKTEGRTTKQKDLDAAERETNELLKNFGGEEAFFKTDFSNPKTFNKAWNNVVKINRLEGTELTQKDKDNITDMRSLIGLSKSAAKLTASQTGIIDSSIKNVKKYITDNAPGVDCTAAIASFRNTLRHALFGSALTDGEIKAFNEAFGENKQKLGPVLKQFKTALNQIQDKLNSTAALGNPYTMKVMVGADQEKIQAIRDALQQRIDYIEGRFVPPSEAAPETEATERPSLDSIFGGK